MVISIIVYPKFTMAGISMAGEKIGHLSIENRYSFFYIIRTNLFGIDSQCAFTENIG